MTTTRGGATQWAVCCPAPALCGPAPPSAAPPLPSMPRPILVPAPAPCPHPCPRPSLWPRPRSSRKDLRARSELGVDQTGVLARVVGSTFWGEGRSYGRQGGAAPAPGISRPAEREARHAGVHPAGHRALAAGAGDSARPGAPSVVRRVAVGHELFREKDWTTYVENSHWSWPPPPPRLDAVLCLKGSPECHCSAGVRASLFTSVSWMVF